MEPVKSGKKLGKVRTNVKAGRVSPECNGGFIPKVVGDSGGTME